MGPIVVLLLAALVSNQGVVADDLVVDNINGSDLQNDRGRVPIPASYGPYRTIARALAAAGPGDRIVLTNTGQPYRECVSLNGPNHSGVPNEPFMIIGNGAVLDGSEPALPDGWQATREGAVLWEYLRTPPGFGLLMLPDGKLQQVTPDSTGPVGLAMLKPLHWTRQNGRFYLRTEPGRSPRDYPLRVTVQTTGITLYDVEHVIVQDLIVRGYRLDGINAHDRASEVQIRNVTAAENGRSGISVGGASRVVLNTVQSLGNGAAQIRTEGRCIVKLRRVTADTATAPALHRDGGEVIGQVLAP